ncbi:hypothetical protein CEXT_175501 [Caerostris extrusa]|uniref:Uncharacterized protein n=1 Tax=Caerostris extrusa TaxID=172846 RepID=A0AAV4TZ27_CAEEX|nr:hypothetical protein CEXT_175501 [Caerostris extrusa]
MINRRTLSLTLEENTLWKCFQMGFRFAASRTTGEVALRSQCVSPINRIEWDLVRILGKKIRFQLASNTYLEREGWGANGKNRIM